ncbi:MAG: putative 2-aminoethylphosphonate ABC transporter ATP-binding protein [Paracoccaceae bacterium]
MTSSAPYLTISGMSKFFGDFMALKDVSLEIERGEFVCFLGPSGCGKTTLLRAVAGLGLQTTGVIVQDGRDISNLPPSERDFGIVFQSYALFPNLTVERNVAFGLENAKLGRAAIKARVDELLDLIGMPEQAQKYPAQLSGGQQQRVALARAIAMSPGLLLLDEPLSALDARVRVHLRHEVKELQRKLGVTTIMVTHDQEEALSMADRIVIMNAGAVEQIGSPTEVYREPVSLFVADFVGEMNKINAVSDGDGGATIGARRFSTSPHAIRAGAPAIAAIRPEDFIPHALDPAMRPPDDQISEEDNALAVRVDQMEFLGSFWRTRLSNPVIGDQQIVADFSMNAVRRMEIDTGAEVLIEIPSRRLKVFPAEADPRT